MSIELTDIPEAVAGYLDKNVKPTVSAITPEDPNQDVLTPGQDARFTVTVTNAATPDGVRLINVTHHVLTTNPNVFELKVPVIQGYEYFETITSTSPLKTGTIKPELFVRAEFDTSLDVGDKVDFPMELHCNDQGTAKVKAHIHADIDEKSLFPNSKSDNGVQSLTVD